MKSFNQTKILNLDNVSGSDRINAYTKIKAMKGKCFYSDVFDANIEMTYSVVFVTNTGDIHILDSVHEIEAVYRDYLKYGAYSPDTK